MNRIQGTSLGRTQNEFLYLPEPSLRALLELGPEEAILLKPWREVHLIVGLPSTSLCSLGCQLPYPVASQVLAFMKPWGGWRALLAEGPFT